MFVYEVEKMSLRGFRELDCIGYQNHWRMGKFVQAALAVKNQVPSLKDWSGAGEYWSSPLPRQNEEIVIIRPDCNPFGAGYVVSPVELPWLNDPDSTKNAAQK